MVTHPTLKRDDADDLMAMSARFRTDRSRLATYAVLGGSASALPFPWVPDVLLRRVRGALVHDVAARHGLSLTTEARAALAEPVGADGPHGLAAQALRFFGVRLAVRVLTRFGPAAALWPLRGALRTYVLGHLLDRYLSTMRSERAVRIDAGEARRVRRAIDGALVRAFSVDTPSAPEPAAIDDQRDTSTALTDTMIGFAARVPDRLMRRLDAAFDDLFTGTHD